MSTKEKTPVVIDDVLFLRYKKFLEAKPLYDASGVKYKLPLWWPNDEAVLKALEAKLAEEQKNKTNG